MSLRKISILLITAAFLCAGVLSFAEEPTNKLYEPIFGADTALNLATKYAIDQNIDLETYNLMSLSFDNVQNRWAAIWMSKEPAIGGHFTIYLSNESSPKYRIVGGL